jgi:hypothetical protein
MAVWYFFPFLVCCTKKNLATLERREEKGTEECFPDIVCVLRDWIFNPIKQWMAYPVKYTKNPLSRNWLSSCGEKRERERERERERRQEICVIQYSS